MFHNRKPACLQDLEDLPVVDTACDVKFGKVAGSKQGATKFGVAR